MKNKFKYQLDMIQILNTVGCSKENPLFNEMAEKFRQLTPVFYNAIKPVAHWRILAAEKLDGLDFIHKDRAVFVVPVAMTIGGVIDEVVRERFAGGTYMEGLMLDAMADAYLFAMGEETLETIRLVLAERGITATGRYSPFDNIEPFYQQFIVENTDAGVTVNKSFILAPAKSSSFILTAGPAKDVAPCLNTEVNIRHDCSRCSYKNCSFRKDHPNVRSVDIGGCIVECANGSILSDVLKENGYFLETPCGGAGVCGKCELIINGSQVKACQYKVQQNIKVEGYQIENKGYAIVTKSGEAGGGNILFSREKGYGIAVDIGTTTVVLSLVSLFDNSFRDTLSFLNPQREYGYDVISRIQKAALNVDNLKAMSKSIAENITAGITSILDKNNISKGQILRMAVAANTAMTYILLGLDCSALGVYPFKTVYNLKDVYSFGEIFHKDTLECPVYIFPFISAFCGGDLVSGLHFINSINEASYILADLGTNGEIALCSHGIIYTASAAAGPAFEGGGITHGVGSVHGAICSLDYQNNNFLVETIGGLQEEPIGICGSGVIDASATLLQAGFIDRTGLFADENHFENGLRIAGDIRIYQNDIRNIQTAKAAVRAGIEILLSEAGRPDIQKFYLAGGFGARLNVENAVEIGLVPSAYINKTHFIGNSALGGCEQLVRMPDKDIQALLHHFFGGKFHDINLSSHEDFNSLFIQYMGF